MTLAAPQPRPALRWPALREDLQLHHGPALPDGQPSWTVHDPVRHKFMRIDWVTYEVLRRWWIGEPAAIAEQVNQQTTLSIGSEHVRQVLEFAQRNQLVHPFGPPPAPAGAPDGWRAATTWLLHHYLFFRIPLFNPDRLLQRGLGWARAFGSRRFTQATLLALAAGLLAVLRDWDAFSTQAVDLISWRGAALYGVTLVGVKVAHEFGHAFVARHHGCRVPTMGLAFMVMWPVAYTDTSEVWRLPEAKARLRVALAGVRTELSIAAWATLAWALLPDGPLRTAAFILCTLTWVTTLVVNLSPFMRFDGYFVLCDALDQPNLHERSFAMARWWLRGLLLGWRAPAPEAATPVMRRAMVGFAFATWAYRLMLYLGIAWLVYHFAFKAVGILLFAVEVGWFIVLPVARELAAWHAARAKWLSSARAKAWWLIAPLLIAAGFVPISSSESAGAVLQPAQHVSIRLPATGVIKAMSVQAGQTVPEGAPLLEAGSPALRQRLDAARVRVRQLQVQVASASIESAGSAQWGSLKESLATANDEVRWTEHELALLNPRAPFAATVLEVDTSVKPGSTVGPQQVLVQLAATGRWRIVAYASETSKQELRVGADASFVADANPLRRLPAKVLSVSPHPSATLAEPMLARAHGGPVEAISHGAHWVISEPLYRVELETSAPPETGLRQWRGHVVLPQPARSLWQRLATSTANVAVREFGF